MTQEQLTQIEAWRESIDEKQNDEHIVNAMWLAEEMWERHHAAMRSVKNIEFSTYMMAFCMTLMEYIWMPHDIIKSITADLDDINTLPEEILCYQNISRNVYQVGISYMVSNDKGHDYEKHELFKIYETKIEAKALTAILNHANKAGHDAVTRLSA